MDPSPANSVSLWDRLRTLFALGQVAHELSRRHNSHSRIYTKKYADGRQKTARYQRLMTVGSHFVAPQRPAPHVSRARVQARKKAARARR